MTRTDAVSQARAGTKEWLAVAVLALPTLLVSMDISVLFLALPHLSADLGADSTQQLWITDIYGFLVAGFLVTMGTLGDRIGRRKVLLTGAAAFAAASLLAAFSTSPEMLIVARAVLGIAGATLIPCTMALISSMFTDPKQRGVAIAAWGTAFMAGVAIGPVVGGVMLAAFWWGSVFVLGVPVMVLLLIVGPRLLPESKDPAGGRIDLLSVALSMVAILPLIYGFKELSKAGPSFAAVATIVAGAVFGVVFVQRQRLLSDPLVDLGLFRHRALSGALVVGLFVGGLQSGTGLMVALYLQGVAGKSPLEAGLWLVPPAIALTAGINVAPHIARRFRPAYVLAGGMAVSVVGQLILVLVSADSGVATLVIGLSVAYLGVGPAAALLNHLILDTAPPEKAGSAASLSGTGGELGVAMGIAALGTIGAAVYRGAVEIPATVPSGTADAVGTNFSAGVEAASHLPDDVAASLLDRTGEAFTTGLNTVAGVCAVLFVALAGFILHTLRHVPPMGSTPDPVETTTESSELAAADESR